MDEIIDIEITSIYLDANNPRHDPMTNQAEIIEYLCAKEQVYELAKDIAQIGLSPIDIFAILDENEDDLTVPTYTILEGNRRLCALKLLNDPELAPSSRKTEFRKLAETFDTPELVPCILFSTREYAKIWLTRIHTGAQGGAGRKNWNAEQIARFDGKSPNRIAQEVLDYAQEKGFIDDKKRERKLTTAQRFISNPIFRSNIGLEIDNPNDVSRSVPAVDFDLMVNQFVTDLSSGEINSRYTKKDIDRYAQKLSRIEGVTGERISSESLRTEADNKDSKPTNNSGKKKQKKPKYLKVPYDTDTANILNSKANFKLQHLYYSICNIPLSQHTPIIAVGAWSFFESLAAYLGHTGNDFTSFFNKNKLISVYKLGTSGKEVNGYSEALDRISKYGNTTKHNDTAANFNGEQLANDFETLAKLVKVSLEHNS